MSGSMRPNDREWVACLNPDAFAEPEWLDKLLTASIQNPQYTFYGRKMLTADDPDLLDGTTDI